MTNHTAALSVAGPGFYFLLFRQARVKNGAPFSLLSLP